MMLWLDNPALLILASVLMHVTWNLLARHVAANANYLWWGLLAHTVLVAPYGIWCLLQSVQWHNQLLLCLLISGLANSLYFLSLRQAYTYAPVALVYPLARSSPILIAIWSALLFSEMISGQAWVAIGIGVSGLWVLAASSRTGDARYALRWSFIAAFATSIYSLSDKLAVPSLPGFGAQLGFISVGYGMSLLLLTLLQYRDTGRCVPAQRPPWRYVLIGGLCLGTAYALVVRAMLYLPAAHVVAFTNGGIVLAVLLSLTLFRERQHWRSRLLGTLIVGVGLVWLGYV